MYFDLQYIEKSFFQTEDYGLYRKQNVTARKSRSPLRKRTPGPNRVEPFYRRIARRGRNKAFLYRQKKRGREAPPALGKQSLRNLITRRRT